MSKEKKPGHKLTGRGGKPHGDERKGLWALAGQKGAPEALDLYNEMVSQFNVDPSLESPIGITTSIESENVPRVPEEIASESQDSDEGRVYTQSYLPLMEPPETSAEAEESYPQIKLSFFTPNVSNDPEFQAYAKEFFGSSILAAEAIAHLESPVKNERSEVFLKREKLKKERYLTANPSRASEEYDSLRERQLKQTREWAQRNVSNNLYTALGNKFNLTEESSTSFLSRQLGMGTTALREIHQILLPGESPLKNEVELPSLSPWHDIQAFLSPNTVSKLQEQIKDIYLLSEINAEIEAANPQNNAGKKLSLIQKLLDEQLFEGMSGQTESTTYKAIFSRGENLLRGIEGITEEISTNNLSFGQNVKEIELQMRTMQNTGIKMYTNANEKSPTSAIAKVLKKALSRATKPGANEEIDAINDVTDTYRLKIAVAGGPDEVDTAMYRVLEILNNPDNSDHLIETDIYGKPIHSKVNSAAIRTWEDDTKINRTSDQSQDEDVFRNRVQIYFSDLHHPVEIIFQSLEEFLRGEFNVGHYNEKKGKFSGIAHELYTIARTKGVFGLLFNKRVYSEPAYQDVDSTSKIAMEHVARKLRKQNLVPNLTKKNP